MLKALIPSKRIVISLYGSSTIYLREAHNVVTAYCKRLTLTTQTRVTYSHESTGFLRMHIGHWDHNTSGSSKVFHIWLQGRKYQACMVDPMCRADAVRLKKKRENQTCSEYLFHEGREHVRSQPLPQLNYTCSTYQINHGVSNQPSTNNSRINLGYSDNSQAVFHASFSLEIRR